MTASRTKDHATLAFSDGIGGLCANKWLLLLVQYRKKTSKPFDLDWLAVSWVKLRTIWLDRMLCSLPKSLDTSFRMTGQEYVHHSHAMSISITIHDKCLQADTAQAISDFLASLSSAEPLHVKRALFALLNIVKELSTARLQLSRRQLQAATPEIIAVVGDIYARAVERWRNGELEQMELSIIAIELAGRLLIAGYDHPNRDPTAASFWSLTIDHLAAFMPLLHSITQEVSLLTEALQMQHQ